MKSNDSSNPEQNKYQKPDLSMQIETFTVGIMGVNCVLVSCKEKAWIFDPGDEPDYLLEAIENRKLILQKIFLTHAHMDHCGYASSFIQAAQKKGILKDDKLYMHAEEEQLYRKVPMQGEMFGMTFPNPDAIPAFLEEGNMDLGECGQMQIFHTPGHSPGSLSFYLPQLESVIVGDVLFQRGIGRTDLWRADHNQLLASIREKLFALPENTRVYPGHGPLTNIGEEKRENPFLLSA